MTATLNHDFITDKLLAPRIGPTPTHARTSVAYARGSDGLYDSFASNTPRFGHSSAGASRGLLVEPAATNYIVHGVYTGVSWNGIAADLTQDNATAPDGTTTACLVEPDNANSSDASVGMATGTPAMNVNGWGGGVMSAFVEPLENLQWVRMGFSGTISCQVYFDIVNGVVGSNVNWGADALAAGIVQEKDGRYRIWIQYDHDGTAGFPQQQILMADGDGDPLVSRSATYSFNAWGLCVTEGIDFLTSPIVTTGSSITRTADRITSSDLSWFNNDEGTLYFKGVLHQADDNAWNIAYAVDGGAVANSFYIGQSNADRVASSFNSDAGNNMVLAVIPAYTSWGDELRGAAAYSLNDCRLINGPKNVADDTTFDPPTASITESAIGTRAGGSSYDFPWSGYIEQIIYWDVRHDNDTLEEIMDGSFPDIGGSQAIIPIGRRTAKQMNVKQRAPKARQTLRGFFE